VVEGQEQQSKNHLEKGRAKVHKGLLETGLDSNHVKESVHHFGHIAPDQSLQVQARYAMNKIKGAPNEKHLAHMLANIELMDIHPTVEDGGQDNHRHDQIQR
jgi:hypothetical protein